MISGPFKMLTARAGVAVAEFILGIFPAQDIDACTPQSRDLRKSRYQLCRQLTTWRKRPAMAEATGCSI